MRSIACLGISCGNRLRRSAGHDDFIVTGSRLASAANGACDGSSTCESHFHSIARSRTAIREASVSIPGNGTGFQGQYIVIRYACAGCMSTHNLSIFGNASCIGYGHLVSRSRA